MSETSNENYKSTVFNDLFALEKSTTWFDDYLTYDSDAANSHPFG